ncbi:MAG: hypothetical protein ACPGLY_23845 [Rubripirellula sp.]
MFFRKIFPFAFSLIFSFAGVAEAIEPLPAASSKTPKPSHSISTERPTEIKIFMRMSDRLFQELTHDVVKVSMPVRECAEGMPIRGQATGKGRTDVQLDISSEKAEFLISLTGTAVASLQADAGPANANLTSHLRFTSQKRFRFDGVQFTSDPATSTSHNNTTIDQISAKRNGIGGRFIERIGSRIADRTAPEVNVMAEGMSQKLISKTFDQIASNLLVKLNQTTTFEKTVVKHFPETKRWEYRLATRPSFLLAGIGPPGATFPEFLNAETEKLEAMMELWLPLTPNEATILKVADELGVTHKLLAEFLTEKEADAIAKEVKLTRRGEWSVIQIGMPHVLPKKGEQ